MSLYTTIDGKRYDKSLLELAKKFAADGGQVTPAEAKRLWEDAHDGKGVTNGKKDTLVYVLRTLKFADTARAYLEDQLKTPESGSEPPQKKQKIIAETGIPPRDTSNSNDLSNRMQQSIDIGASSTTTSAVAPEASRAIEPRQWVLLILGLLLLFSIGRAAMMLSEEPLQTNDSIRNTVWEAFPNSFLMIICTELGDKTFFIAAILAMRNDRRPVFLGAAGALAAMTILSAAIGRVLPALLPREYTHWAAVLLFVYFGFRQLSEAIEMVRNGEGDGPSDELQEVEKSLEDKTANSVALQALTLTFLAEWGDRSQIATIALAAAKEPLGVALGGIVGHSCCTSLAVAGGRVLASRISERVVIGAGGVLFIGFALHGMIVGP